MDYQLILGFSGHQNDRAVSNKYNQVVTPHMSPAPSSTYNLTYLIHVNLHVGTGRISEEQNDDQFW